MRRLGDRRLRGVSVGCPRRWTRRCGDYRVRGSGGGADCIEGRHGDAEHEREAGARLSSRSVPARSCPRPGAQHAPAGARSRGWDR